MTIFYLFAWHGQVWCVNSHGECWKVRGNRTDAPIPPAAEMALTHGFQMEAC